MTILDAPIADPPSSATQARWDELARAVRAFDPAIVILIARKAPRIAQALDLKFGHDPLVITDLAIPLSSSVLRGARVAIVDDVVNVGSTLARAKRAVLAAGAHSVKVFAVSEVARGQRPPELADAEILDPRPLNKSELAAFAANIPLQLQRLARPYDLDFPLIVCSLERGPGSFAHLSDSLREQFGDHSVYDLSTTAGVDSGIWRLAIDPPDKRQAHRKLRLYVDERRGRCVLVPIHVETPLPTDAPIPGWCRAIWEILTDDIPDDLEARGRVRLFLDSLDFGLRFALQHRHLLRVDQRKPFDLDEAELVLGPKIRRVSSIMEGWPLFLTEITERPNHHSHEDVLECSPFATAMRTSGLLSEIPPHTDALSAVVAFFNRLADWVGASDPRRYRLDWPYSRDEIAENPYLRLRIGPTMGDLVSLVSDITGDDDSLRLRDYLTRLLDRFIDNGGVVPTTATYGEFLYRVYRKGEKDPRDQIAQRTRRAWYEYGKPLSLTRVTKLVTILAYTEDRGESAVTIKTDKRGNVLCYAASVLHDETEISHHLLRTGQLTRS